MTAYAVVELAITNLEGMAPYLAGVPGTIAAHGGKYLVVPGIEQIAGNGQIVEGGPDDLPVKVILEFPSLAAGKDWYNSAEYRALLPHRQKNARGKLVWVEGV